MNIDALPIKVTEKEAIKLAKEGKGSFFSKIISSKMDAHEVRLHYIEFKWVTVEVKYNKPGFRKSNNEDKIHKLNILVNGSTGTGIVAQDLPKVVKVKNINEDIIQYSSYEDARIKSKAIKMAMRISHRFMGGTPDINIINIESFFRPYWIVFFGEVKNNSKVRYLPIEADGFVINRGI